MTICFPQIINRSLDCPREELTFSNTPPTCVRVVPVYADEAQVIGEIPPRVHFYITDDGEVYQLAPIQSPPSVPPEYHAVLDSTGCILVGVEFGTVTRGKILPIQIALLPGVLRYILTTLGLPISSIQNGLPPDRCNPQQFQQILTATQNCLLQTPPTPPDPCAFVLSCVGNNAIQVADTPTLDLTLTGNTVSGQVVVSPNPNNQLQALPNGLFVPPSTASITVTDTNTIDLTFSGGNLSATAILNPSPNNTLVATPTGLFVPPAPVQTVSDTGTVDLTLSGGNLSAQVIISPNPNNQLQALPNGLFVPPSSGALNPIPTTINGAQGAWLFWDGNNLRFADLNNYYVPYGTTGNANQGGLYFVPSNVSFQFSDSTIVNTSLNSSLIVTQGALSGSLVGSNSQAFLTQGGLGVPSSLLNSSIFAYQSAIGAANTSFDTTSGHFTFVTVPDYNSFNSRLTLSASSGNTFVTSSSNASVNSTSFGFIQGIESTFSIGFSSLNNASFQTSYSAINTTVANFVSIQSAFNITNRISNVLTNLINVNGAMIIDNLQTGANSFFDIRNSFSVHSRISANQPINVINYATLGIVSGSDFAPGNPTADYRDSIIVTSGDSFVASPNRVPSNVFASVFVGRLPQNVFTQYSSFASVHAFEFNITSPNQLSRQSRGSIIAAGGNSVLTKSLDEGSILAVSFSEESLDNIITVGDNLILAPAIRSLGGYQVLFGRGGRSNLELWRSQTIPGQNMFWYGTDAGTLSFANNAQATTYLNSNFGADPRLRFGTMTIMNVAGQPALFAWNGSSFVRITV